MWRTVAPRKFESSQTPNADAWSFMIDTGNNAMIECRTRQGAREARGLHTVGTHARTSNCGVSGSRFHARGQLVGRARPVRRA